VAMGANASDDAPLLFGSRIPGAKMSTGKGRRGSVKEVGPGGTQEYFDQQVEAHGGTSEVFDKGPGARFRPDRVVTWPCYAWAHIHFVEMKTIGGELSSGQERDHARRRAKGSQVFVLWTKKMVDEYVERYAVHPA
jgi:hypothetical protein